MEIKVNLRTIIKVNPTVHKYRSALSVMLAVTNENLTDRYKQEHSRSMNPVLEEVSPNLKSIRNCLFGLRIKKIPPKANRHSIKATNAPQVTSAFNFADKNDFKKTGKVSYSVLVGNASKQDTTVSPKQLTSIDLHGLCIKKRL